MRADSLLRFVWVADPQISPDGARVAVTRVHVDADADEYRTSIWLADAAASERARQAPRPLTAGHYDSQAFQGLLDNLSISLGFSAGMDSFPAA